MKKSINKYINIESYNTINNDSTETKFITVNRLTTKNDNKKTIINQKRKNNISEENCEFKPFIYRKKSQLEKSNSFYIRNRKNLSLRNDKSLTKHKENKPLLLIPSYKHFDLKKKYNNSTNKKSKNKSKKKPECRCSLNLSRNNQYKNNKDLICKNYINNSRFSQNKTRGNSTNSTGISLGGDINKNTNINNIRKLNCYSFDDDFILKDEPNSNNTNNINYIFRDDSVYKKENNDNKTNKYIQIIEKENEILKTELMKTNHKLNLLERKIENLIEGKINRSNTQTIMAKSRIPSYKRNNIIKKCPVPTPYVQKFSKNDFFSTKNKNIKVTLKLKKKIYNEESKNNY